MKILILNGSNLNLLGIREPDKYGNTKYEDLCDDLIHYSKKKNIELEIYQSNHEGSLIDKIQEAYFNGVKGIIINPGGYTHTSVSIRDAISSVNIPCVEVHITNILKREKFRKIDLIEDVSVTRIMGHGVNGYFEAIDFLCDMLCQH